MTLRDQLQQTLGAAYTVDSELGGGGMSRVLVAHESALGRKVVVKVLRPELAATVSVERFRREIMLAAALQHPHIVPLLSAGETDGLPYFVMPFVEGESLRTRLVRGRLSIPEAVRILRDVARALAYAHERGIVHRDIKPDNVLISSGSAMVADFGVAKALAAARGMYGRVSQGDEPAHTPIPGTITLAGTSLGTPAYMAPEQAAADPSIDHRADLYSFGVMAYEVLTGAPPFEGATPQALLAAQLTERPRPLAVHRADVPAALADLVARCLEKEPARRPQSAAEVAAALEDPAVVSGAFVSAPSVVTEMLPRAHRPRTLPIVAAAVAIVVAAAGIWYAATNASTRPSTAPGPAAAAAPAAPAAAPATSIAVLPLVSIGGDASDQRFAEGIAEELTIRLSRLSGVRVASRTAALSVRGRNASVAEIGRLLNVGTLLEGTVQREGTRLRLTARLVNVGDGYTVWSDVYESEVKSVFAAQTEISSAIVAALGEALGVAAPGVDGAKRD